MLELLLIVVILLIIALVIYLFFSKNRKTKKSTKVPTTQTAIKTPLEENIIHLITLNVAIRSQNIPKTARDAIEKTIDALRELLPPILENHEKSEMGWVMKRMCSHYLPKLINPFIALSNQEDNLETFLESLSGIDKELDEVAQLLSSANTSEFESKARFIKHRFN